MAGNPAVRLDGLEHRALDSATIHGVRAPRMERAARWRTEQRWWQTRNSCEDALLFQRWQARDEQPRVRVERLFVHSLHGADFDQLTGVHDPEAIHELSH